MNEELCKCLCGGTPTPPTPVTKDFGGLRPLAQGFGSGAIESQPVYGSPNIGGRGGSIYIVDTLADNRNAPTIQARIRKRHPRIINVPDIRSHMSEPLRPTIQFALPRLLSDTIVYRSSLRVALEASGPRYVVSEVGGNIVLNEWINITNPYLTLGLQTAPSPGINIVGQVQVNTHDVYLSHFRLRFPRIGGQGSSDTVPLTFGGGDNETFNIYGDHLSIAFANNYMSFASADMTGRKPNPFDVNISNCIIAYPLTSNNFYYEGYGAAFWTSNNSQISALRNLFVHSSHRNLNAGSMRIQNVDNRVYGSGPDDSWLVLSLQAYAPGLWPESGPGYQTQGLMIGNHFYPSYGSGSGIRAGTAQGHHTFNMQFSRENVFNRGDRIYLLENRGPYVTGPDLTGQFAGIYWQQDEFTQDQICVNQPFDWHTRMNIERVPETDDLSASVGARARDRDTTDLTAIQQYHDGQILNTQEMGQRIADPSEISVDIYNVPQTFRKLDIPDDPNSIADEFGRTVMDVWLNDRALEVEV